MSFRRSLIAVVGLIAILACQPEPECADACGTAIVATPGPFGTFFPPAIVAAADNEVANQIFWKLADLDSTINTAGDANFEPRLASTWTFETPSTIVFTMNPDARWHDGEPVTAHDVAFTFDVYRDPAIGAEAGVLMDRVERVTARDDRTVVFEFSEPYVEQFFDATYHMRIIPRHLLDSIPRDRLLDHPFGRAPVGSGPYRFHRENSDGSIELRADTGFFLGRPGIARVIWRPVANPGAALQALEAGDADIAPIIVGAPGIERAIEMEDIVAVEYRSPFYSYLGFNVRSADGSSRPHPLFGNRELRRALTAAVDRRSLPSAVLGPYATAPKGPFGPLVRTSRLELPQIRYDPDAARAILDSLGWTDSDGDGIRDRNGRPLAFSVITPPTSLRVSAAVQIQSQLQQIGAQLEIEEIEFGVFLERVNDGRMDAYMGSWGVDPSPSAVRGIWHSDAINGNNWSNYANPRFDRLLEEVRDAADAAHEAELWREAYTVLNEDAVAIWAYVPAVYAGVHRRFDNVSIRSDAWYATLWTWRVRPDALLERDRFVQP